VDEQTWNDWLQLRRQKRATVTATVLDEARKESIKAGMTLQRFLTVWCARGSQGLQADWLKTDKTAKSFREQDIDAKRDRVREMTGGLLGNDDMTIDMEMEARCVALIPLD
jgi:hypothetical protein